MTYLSSITSASLFFLVGMSILSNGHPHEDAYILYIYAENLAQNASIQYYQNGPNTEGATDFLWLIFLALGGYIGLSVATTALFVNAIGMGYLVNVLLRVANQGRQEIVITIAISATVLIYLPAQAAVGGFSTAIFAAVIAAMINLVTFGNSRQLLSLPILGLLLALLRPDGLIIAVSAIISGVFLVKAGDRKQYFLILLLMSCAAIGYFLWRQWYFGAFLPLPIYVKTASMSVFPGLTDNLRWILLNLPLVAAFLWVVLRRPLIRTRFTFAAIGPVLHFTVLLFTTQSQNIAFRFQTPICVLLLFAGALVLGTLTNVRRRVAYPILMTTALIFAFQLHRFSGQTERLLRHDYINSLPFYLADSMSTDTKTVLTEAGRFAYWTPGVKLDLVGLNTLETAKHGASAEYIQNQDPDLIFWHTADILSLSCEQKHAYCAYDAATLKQQLDNANLPSASQTSDHVQRAAIAAFDHVAANPNTYDLRLVRYQQSYSHMYAIKREGDVSIAAFDEALSRSHEPESAASYMELFDQRLQ